MFANQKKALLLLVLILVSIHNVKAGPAACAACLTAVGGVLGGSGTAAAGCFTLGFPPAVCTCLAGLGFTVGLLGVMTCIPVCLAPTP